MKGLHKVCSDNVQMKGFHRNRTQIGHIIKYKIMYYAFFLNWPIPNLCVCLSEFLRDESEYTGQGQHGDGTAHRVAAQQEICHQQGAWQ